MIRLVIDISQEPKLTSLGSFGILVEQTQVEGANNGCRSGKSIPSLFCSYSYFHGGFRVSGLGYMCTKLAREIS